MDLEVLSPVENQQEFAKFKSMASTSKPIAEYLKSINETGRHPVRAELYAAEDLSAWFTATMLTDIAIGSRDRTTS